MGKKEDDILKELKDKDHKASKSAKLVPNISQISIDSKIHEPEMIDEYETEEKLEIFAK